MVPEFDTSKFYLSVLCKKGHDWEGTGQSLRDCTNSRCLECENDRQQKAFQEFDPNLFYLGTLCRKGHDWNNTGQSVRYHSTTRCLICSRERHQKIVKSHKEKTIDQKQLSKNLLDGCGIDTEKYYLGKLCKRSHDWNGSGFTLRWVKGGICPECKRITDRLWEKRNPELVREIGRRKRAKDPGRYKRYYHRNLDRVRARGVEKYRKYKERHQKRMRKWYLENREQVIERSKEYQQTPIGKMVRKGIHNRRRATILRTRLVPYSPADLKQHFEKFGDRCVYCGSPDHISVDHFIPLAKGGSDCLGNLVPCCLSCNTSKNATDALEWYQRQTFYDRKRWKKILEVLGKDNPNQLPLF